MRVIRLPRGRLRHLTADLQVSLCGRRLKAAILEPDAHADCTKCIEVDTLIFVEGN